jgi:hypothetical protein
MEWWNNQIQRFACIIMLVPETRVLIGPNPLEPLSQHSNIPSFQMAHIQRDSQLTEIFLKRERFRDLTKNIHSFPTTELTR